MLKELARAEDAANKGIPRSSSTSHAITGLIAVPGEVSRSRVEATADDSSKSTARFRVACTEKILGSDSVALCRTMGVHRQVEDQILMLDSDDIEQVLQVNERSDIDLEVVFNSGACERVMANASACQRVRA